MIKVLYKKFVNEQIDYNQFRSLLARYDIDALNLFDTANIPGTTKCFDSVGFLKSYTRMACERSLVQ